MRFVVFGAGAIGGAVTARLHGAGHEVIAIARGAHLEALRRDGLTFVTPEEHVTIPIESVERPTKIRWRPDDVVLLCTKSQDTLGALTSLRDAAGCGVAVVCLQNGVENERVALRLLERVYAAVVMLPAAHLEPGVVLSYGTALTGMLDIGRYPGSVDPLCEEICAAFSAARFEMRALADVMRAKYAKLLLNLANAPDAVCAPGPGREELIALAKAEGEAALQAAGVEFVDDEVTDIRGRWERMGVGTIEGAPRAGSSTWQSLARGAGAIETDHLNGEIVLQGRLHGVPTPVNATLCRLAADAARARRAPQTMSAREVLAMAGAGHTHRSAA
ncbi:MAG: ketopantoate reductase family protein [Solirubrobacteraceae bacterium]